MNKRFKVACLATLTVGMLAVTPAQAGLQDWRDQIITGISTSGVLASMYLIKDTALSGILGGPSFVGLAYSLLSLNNRRKVNGAAELIAEEKETVHVEAPNNFSMSESNVSLPTQAPKATSAEKVKINVWLEEKAASFADINEGLLNTLLKDATPQNKDSSAKIDLNEYDIAYENRNDKKNKQDIYQAVYQEMVDLRNTKNRLGDVLQGSWFVTKLNACFRKQLKNILLNGNINKLKRSIRDIKADEEGKLFTTLTNFRKNFLKDFGIWSWFMPNVERASELYIETFRREHKLVKLVEIIENKWKNEISLINKS